MSAIENLKNEFIRLAKLTRKNEIEEQLQCIMAYFLRNFSLTVNNKTVKPVEVEAYYYMDIFFEDKYVHREKGLQDNHFGQLYFHKMNGALKTGTYKGMDVCLSLEKGIFLALLIRSAEINGRAVYGPSNCVKEIFVSDEAYKEKYENEQKQNALAVNSADKGRLHCGERYGLSAAPKDFENWEDFYKMQLRMFIGEFEENSSVKIKAKRNLKNFC